MKKIQLISLVSLGLSLGGLAACSAQSGTEPGEGVTGTGVVPGTKVSLALGPAAEAEKQALDAELAQVKDLDAASFAERTAVSFEELGYAPSDALGLDLIQGSSVQLNAAELAKLNANGFVISTRQQFPTFAYGYATLYGDDLPLFVSADSILYALHRSYDSTLKSLESSSLAPALTYLLSSMKTRLDKSSLEGALKKDVDLFLTVGQSLLAGAVYSPNDSALASQVTSLVSQCESASGAATIELFGSKRIVDFSQCKPRGHYTDSPELERYFRAMMWFGRTDFRLIETQEDGSQLFNRRQLEAAVALRELLSSELFESQQAIEGVITAFVGEHDSMTLPQVDQLKEQLSIGSVSELAGFSDDQLAQAIVQNGFGTQRIASHYVINGVGAKTLPLSSSFSFFGQRYVIDSHVFSNVVYDRAGGGGVMRMMPDPLDVAYAALGNDQAGMLLAPQLEEYAYAPDLASMRVLADSEGDAFWSQNLYNSWLGALRSLSPASAQMETAEAPLPSVARTEAWGRRLLNTQLASWAELRHDTILYAKQSYTGGVTCEFPDAYVEPYPELFARVKSYADHAVQVLEALPFDAPQDSVLHYQHFSSVAGILEEMAEHQRTGTPHSEAAMQFINEAVHVQEVCGGAYAEGWYPKLFFGVNSTETDPTIADVHTQPMDEAGNEVGRVLHVGTGNARLMVVTFDTCSGPRAYAGLASSYYELVTEDFERLSDPDWETRLGQDPPSAPTWQESILAE